LRPRPRRAGKYSVIVVNRKFGSLFLLVCLLSAPPARAAQADAAKERAAVKKLVHVTQMAAASSRLFDELVTRYQKNWADSVITDFRNRGVLKPYSAADVPRIEHLIREMGDNTFAEIKRRAAREVYTDEFMEAVTAPSLEKLLTAEELEGLLVFFETPTGKKLLSTSYKLLADEIVGSFEERGFFRLLPSADEESARIDRLTAEMRSRPPVQPERIMAAWRALPADYFSTEEKLQLLSFAATPAAAKLGENFPQFLRDVMANVAPHAPRVGQMTTEVFNQNLEAFARRLGELKIAPAQGRAGGGRRPRR
jgi:hypothetical protein